MTLRSGSLRVYFRELNNVLPHLKFQHALAVFTAMHWTNVKGFLRGAIYGHGWQTAGNFAAS